MRNPSYKEFAMLYEYQLKVFNYYMDLRPMEIRTGMIELKVCPRQQEFMMIDGLEVQVTKVVHSTAGVKLELEHRPGGNF